MRKTERLAALHQISAAQEAANARYMMGAPHLRAVEDYAAGYQRWAARYALYAREKMGITDTDQFYA